MFVVTDGVIRTPGDGSILQGVSRGAVVDVARQLDMPVVEEELQPYDLYTADEAFFSSTFVCVMPVTRIDNRPVGDGRPGPVTQQLLAAWSETVGMDIVGPDGALRRHQQLVQRAPMRRSHAPGERRVTGSQTDFGMGWEPSIPAPR